METQRVTTSESARSETFGMYKERRHNAHKNTLASKCAVEQKWALQHYLGAALTRAKRFLPFSLHSLHNAAYQRALLLLPNLHFTNILCHTPSTSDSNLFPKPDFLFVKRSVHLNFLPKLDQKYLFGIFVEEYF